VKPADGIEEGNQIGAESRPSEGGVPVDREGHSCSTIGFRAVTKLGQLYKGFRN
jgi:hypothetical protein